MRAFLFLSFLLFLAAGQVSAQERAITESGDTIYVYPDGTWKYELNLLKKNKSFLDIADASSVLDTSEVVYTSAKSNIKKLTSGENQTSLNYDPTIWNRHPPAQFNELAEFVLATPTMESFVMALNEPANLGTNRIYYIAMQNITGVADSPPQVIEEEYRLVNGIYLISSIYRASVQGYDLIYHTYFYSGEEGTIQLFTWTLADTYESKKSLMEDVLNGLMLENTEKNED